MAEKTYYPELKDEKPEAKIEASFSYYGNHYYLSVHPDVPELKGRGIVNRTNEVHWVPGTQKAVEGWRSYKVTIKAYEKICAKHSVSYAIWLD